MIEKLPPSVRLDESIAGYPFFHVIHAKCEGRVALHGAHVTSWRPTNQAEVLYVSPDAVYREGKAIRGGIPICWPWFNAHPSDASLPAHGLVRSRFWEFAGASENEDGVTLCFRIHHDPWHAEVVVFMGDSLEVSLTSVNLTQGPLQISGALHTYISVDDVRAIGIGGLDDCDYLDTVGCRTMRRQEGAPVIDREVDRIYVSDAEVFIKDPGAGRVISVGKTGSPSTVVWNPWMEKAAALADMPNEDYLRFLCVEAAIANEKAITLQPDERHVLSTKIQVL